MENPIDIEMCDKDFDECKKCNHLGSPDCSRFVNDYKRYDNTICGKCGMEYCERHN